MPAPVIPSPLILVGFMGCGKSTTGRLLAQRLGWHFCDLDDRIEAAAGASISAIFAQQGEPAYRELEHHQLLAALGEASQRRTVLALGGGTFVQPQNLEPIRAASGRTIFIEVPVEELLLRCAAMTNRPLFRDAVSFRQLHTQRQPFYQQAHHTVNGSGATPAQLADRILAALAA